MSCVLLEHVKHGSMKIWYIIIIYNIYRSLFLRGRTPEICLSSTLFKTTGREIIFWHNFFLETAKVQNSNALFLEVLPLGVSTIQYKSNRIVLKRES